MTRPRRGGWRWWGKWATLTVGVGIAAAWLVSGWWRMGFAWGRGAKVIDLEIVAGAAYLTRFDDYGGSAWASRIFRNDPAPSWVWHFDFDVQVLPARSHSFVWAGFGIPLWAPFLPLAACSAWLWWLDRKPKPGHCPRCRYDLSATPPSAPCPECGEGGRAPQSPNAQAAEPAARTTP
jgi:hypothetical protein